MLLSCAWQGPAVPGYHPTPSPQQAGGWWLLEGLEGQLSRTRLPSPRGASTTAGFPGWLLYSTTNMASEVTAEAKGPLCASSLP